MEISGKVVIITGASSGIGEATARLFAQKGAKVALVARSKEKLESISSVLKDSLVVVGDMSKEEDIKRMVQEVKKHFGRIDILINNAGIGYDAPIESIDTKKFKYLIDLDLVGPVIAMREVIPHMREQKGGVIVNISSGTALMALPAMGAYSSLKRAMVGISLTAREELKDNGIIVSVVYPFATKTNFEKNTMKDNVPEEEWDGGDMKIDTADYVAEKIEEAVVSGKAEIFAHDWMKR